MTPNRRVFLNIVATYGRSLYALGIGLFCGRWMLMALGEVDYGLFGLVGGLTVFIAFFNSVLAGANSRFYAYSVGAAQVAKDKNAALEECRRWFNTAISIHTVIPFVLIVIGYPIGEYAVEHWLVIPAERINACVWVFRFMCLSCFVGMVTVPFTAMYNAKQYIAELTIYSFATTTLNIIVLGYMVYHPAEWLTKFAAWSCILAIAPQLIICWRAVAIFPECQFNLKYMWDLKRLRKLGSYSGWQMLGVFCSMLRHNGISIVINKFFGARMNASQTIGNTLQAQCNTLASAMQGAFVPVITQACGAGDYEKMKNFALRTCKFNVVLFILFALPLCLELNAVLLLWLKNPPPHSAGLCLCAMAYNLADCCTVGHMVVVNATGRIAAYHVVLCAINVLTLPFAIVVGLCTRNVYCVMGVVVVMQVVNSLGRVLFARILTGMSVCAWLHSVIGPSSLAIVLCGLIGYVPHVFMAASFVRVVATTVFCEIVFLPLAWFVLLSRSERMYVMDRIRPKLKSLLWR